MNSATDRTRPRFERAVVVISLDAEQIWGYLNLLDQRHFSKRYPNAVAAHDLLLDRLCAAYISATWALVGALSLEGLGGPDDPRLQGLPRRWIASVPAATEALAPIWYRRSFARRLQAADPPQDIGLHGGLTHLVWTDPHSTIDVIERELAEGLGALEEISVQPRSFIFARQRIAHLELLRSSGIRCYRGNVMQGSDSLNNKIPRAIARAFEEAGRATPPVVWPTETFPGLWNIPGSLALYPIGKCRTGVIPAQNRIERVRRGVEAALKCGGMFHYWFHPDTLAEAPSGFSILEAILEILTRARDAGNIEILTMAQVVDRMEMQCEEPIEAAICGATTVAQIGGHTPDVNDRQGSPCAV